MLDAIHILFPLLLMLCGGYVISRCFSLPETDIVRLVTDFFMPLLVFHSFCTTKISATGLLTVAAAVAVVVAGMVAVSWFYCKYTGLRFNAVAPPLLFMNSGFLGIPMMKLWGGAAAMNLVVLYDQVQTFFIFTLGIMIVSGTTRLGGLREVVKSPLIWAIVLGLAVNFTRFEIPGYILQGVKFGGEAAPPMAIFAIGMMLNRFRLSLNWHVLAGVFMRLGCGSLFGAAATVLLGISGQAAVVVIVASSLPSAVFSVVLPVRYGIDGTYASSVLLISTFISFLVLPFIFQFATFMAY